MLTKNEVTALNLSPTKKDFVQIWNELLEVAGKLSERWDPSSTNESDPGIVILKALTGIADKLNYNIDKNILEAFMPTAAQEDSMRKLCDMLGYSMKYYRSAIADVTIKYYNPEPSADEKDVMQAPGLLIPKFTVITNGDQDISYFTINQTPRYISAANPVTVPPIPCMEGQIVKCESVNDNNVITVNQITEQNRFYLPETQIAENGIFIYNIFASNGADLEDGTQWSAVANLNTQSRGAKVYKFGFDSYAGRPYVEFPEDYSELFDEGIFIYYTRTSGVNGNVSPRTLTQIELPTTGNWSKVSTSSFSAENVSAASDGANAEGIGQAYRNFKKTIGTFETLVTCRDYMNKVYSLIKANGRPMVSNILVTDIKNDLNRAVTICSCDDAGIFYKETPININTEAKIDHFDLIFYPFKAYNQIKGYVKDIRTPYDASFAYAGNNTLADIKNALEAEGIKTIAHNIKSPDTGDVLSINNYLRLTATIATNSKVTTEEGTLIIENIKVALANAFNMRELDFGEEIPFDSIVEVIEKADARIKVASLNEPAIYTTFSVLESNFGGTPTVAEYAVASDWLDLEMASSINRLAKNSTDGTVSTFDTKKAREVYNKLAVRNVLAGRIPLFDYNTTFKTGFSEGAYEVTTIVEDKPKIAALLKIARPTIQTPYIVALDDGRTYAGKLARLQEKPAELMAPTADTPVVEVIENGAVYTGILNDTTAEYSKIVYTETHTPSEFKDNLITGGSKPTTYITNIKTTCELPADEHANISDVSLASGEVVKFRAPNFITTKTFPAYVNYHLALAGDKAIITTPKAAKAKSLFELLNTSGTSNDPIPNWHWVFSYFTDVDAYRAADEKYVKKVKIEQVISAYKPNEPEATDSANIGEIVIDIDNKPLNKTEYTIEKLLALSGCLRILNSNFEAELTWTPKKGETQPAGKVPVQIKLNLSSPYITNINVVTAIKEAVQAKISELRNLVDDYGRPRLPASCSWTVSFSFDCVPFEPRSLAEWEKFISAKTADMVEGFAPAADNSGTVLWRKFGEGYDVGKYVTEDTAKLLKFDASYFGLLPDNRLQGVFVAETLGADAVPTAIKNGEEYRLRQGEQLFIEYTPSTTTETGTTKEQSAITEVYGPGTIFKPSGFEAGLTDSEVSSRSKAYTKFVTFASETGSGKQVGMHSLGANEQIAIREPAKVTLGRDSVLSSSTIYIYKNFNDCPELENKKGRNGNRSYILKDGEYIFYTDQNKAELAYFTTGTQVTLSGAVVLPQYDLIELSEIFDSGIQEIPWSRLSFDTMADTIEFQEYQYVTLGTGDTLNSLRLVSNDKVAELDKLSSEWVFCSDVAYTLADDTSTVQTLPAINLGADRLGNGWEVCSMLELAVSPNYAQTLRSTPKINTGLILTSVAAAGNGTQVMTVKPSEYGNNNSLSFKTNLACLACGNEIDISKVISNPNDLKSFQLKVFRESLPAIYETEPGTLIPYGGVSIEEWGSKKDAKYIYQVKKDGQNPWNTVALSEIGISSDKSTMPDNALQLSVSLLPDTYGIFCLYLDHKNSADAKTWIEVLPGTSHNDITLVNTDAVVWENGSITHNIPERLYLNQGINCVCVNRSCKIYVKTSFVDSSSTDTNGILLFDELRLVNTKEIRYTDADNKSLTLTTKGLNLGQIGYLDISTATDANTEDLAAVNEAAISEQKLARAEAAITKMHETERLAFDKISADRTELVSYLQKISKLVDAEKQIAADLSTLTKLYSTDSTKLTSLITLYNSLNATLTNEKKLLAALENSKNTEVIEQQLAELLKSFTADDSAKQQLLTTWTELKDTIYAELENLQDSDVVMDFEQSAFEIKAEAFAAVKKLAAEKIQEQYQKQVASLADDLAQVVGSDASAKLLSLLRSIQTSNTSAAWSELDAKVSELSGIVNTDIDRLLEYIVTAATTPDYVQLLALLVQLRNTVDSDNLRVLVPALEQAVEARDNALLTKLLETVIDATGTVNLNTVTNTNILAKIDAAYSVTQNNIDSAEVILAVTNAVNDLKTVLSTEYTEKLKTVFTAISNLLKSISIETDVSALIVELENSDDSQVSIIIENLTDVIAQHKILLAGTEQQPGLNSFATFNDWQRNSSAAYISESIAQLWPEFIEAALTSILRSIDTIFGESFEADLNALAQRQAELEKLLDPIQNKQITRVRSSLLHTVEITHLFDSLETIASTEAQKAADASVVSTISSSLVMSAELTAAITACNGKNILISKLLDDYLHATNVIYKQQTLVQLKDQLNAAIQTNTALLSTVSIAICPGISTIELDNELINEVFYKELLAYAAATKLAIVSGTSIGSIPSFNDQAYLTLIALPEAEFYTASQTFNLAASLLPQVVIDLLAKIKTSYADYMRLEVSASYFTKQDLASPSSKELAAILAGAASAHADIKNIINDLILEIDKLEQQKTVDADYMNAYKVKLLEDRLLADIKRLDANREFYYNVLIEDSLAIELNEVSSEFNTLMNPMVNYDINNVNNSFVISKLDIDYLTRGIQIARSSRYN